MQPHTLTNTHTHNETHKHSGSDKQKQKPTHTATHAQNTCAVRDLALTMAPTYAAICVTVEGKTDEMPILLGSAQFFFSSWRCCSDLLLKLTEIYLL